MEPAVFCKSAAKRGVAARAGAMIRRQYNENENLVKKGLKVITKP
jgi:hypothetical protein